MDQAANPANPANPAVQPAALRPQQFCQRYNVGRTKLYELLNDKKVEARKDGKATLIDAGSAERWFLSLPKFGESAAA